MKLCFHGATGDVTGSAYHVKTRHASVLVDCGLFQGGKEEKAKNYRPARLEGGRLDAVVLTHGHLDHVGRLPLLTGLQTGLVPGPFPGRELRHLPGECVLASPQTLFATVERLRQVFPLPLQLGALLLDPACEFE